MPIILPADGGAGESNLVDSRNDTVDMEDVDSSLPVDILSYFISQWVL